MLPIFKIKRINNSRAVGPESDSQYPDVKHVEQNAVKTVLVFQRCDNFLINVWFKPKHKQNLGEKRELVKHY